jgi:peroxiredoxin
MKDLIMFRSVYLALLVAVALSLGTQSKADAQTTAKQYLEEALKQMAEQDSFSVQIGQEVSIETEGGTQKVTLQAKALLSGDQNLFFDLENENFKMQVFSDEDSQFVHDVTGNFYLELSPRAPRPTLFHQFINAKLGVGLRWISLYLEGDAELLTDVETWMEASEAPDENGNRHLQYEEEAYKVDLWLASDAPWKLHKYRLALKMDEGSVVFDTVLSDWNQAPSVDAATFRFSPPKDALTYAEYRRKKSDGSLMVGRDAPAVELALVDGGNFRLADHKGKDIVLLDFWATWCGPCRMSMPVLDKVAKAFANRGVKVITVNSSDDPEAIKAFREQMDISLPVVLDVSGKVSNAYNVEKIPHMVVINKAGKVQKVHLGADPSLEVSLTEELNAMLSEAAPK